MSRQDFNWRKASYSNSQGSCVEVGNWRKASHSNGTGACIEAGQAPGLILIRDTTLHEAGPVLGVTTGMWNRFLGAVR